MTIRTQPGVYWLVTATITGVLACRGNEVESTDAMGGGAGTHVSDGVSTTTLKGTNQNGQGGAMVSASSAKSLSSLGGNHESSGAPANGGKSTNESSGGSFTLTSNAAGGATDTPGSTQSGATSNGARNAGGTKNTGGTTSTKTTATASVGGTTSPSTTAAKGGTASTAAGGTSASTSSPATNPGDCTIPAPSSLPVGYGAAATGGGEKTPIEVSTMEALVAELAKYKKGTAGLVLKYTGAFDFKTISDPCAQHTKAAQTVDIKEVSNMTLIGAKGSAANFGLHVSKAHNIVIRNMTIGLLPGGGSSDAIGIEGESSDIWIDHNELFSSMVECDGAGDTEFDGLLDTKDGSHHITISYNYFHDHHKVALNGSSDSDTGERLITFHHNRFDNVGSRTPLQRDGTTHIFNNYFNRVITSGINVRLGGISLIESNYFENCQNPVTSRDSSSIGYWDLRDNFVGSGITWTTPEDDSSPFANASDWKTSKAFTATLAYSYTADPAACVKAIAAATAGAKL